ncbi:PLP-dependent aminotransferase family protein [Photobacterium sagamiensis]|uniref:aminotransferase-like domain-containing protein n=1 Tax=Photobacterium sagamiensis TaxID=2910241 RepID=UPI003D0A8ECE
MRLTQKLSSNNVPFVDELFAAAIDPGIISLAGGLPDPDTFPEEIISSLGSDYLKNAGVYQYGSSIGYRPLVDYLSADYELEETGSLMMCNGAQQGLDLVARAFLDESDSVVMEVPNFVGAIQVFKMTSAAIIAVPPLTNDQAFFELEKVFRDRRPKVFYAVPDFSNPTGFTWSLATRKRVANLCIQYGVILLEDVPYRQLRFSGTSHPLASKFCPGNSIVLRSFSKVTAPGFRLCSVSGSNKLLAPLIKLKQITDIHSSLPMQALLLEVLKHPGFSEHLSKVRRNYNKRYSKMMAVIRGNLPSSFEVDGIEGGMFVWMKVPKCDTLDLADYLLQKGIAVMPSASFYPDGNAIEIGIRINFTSLPYSQIENAVIKLCNALNDYSYNDGFCAKFSKVTR